MKQLTGMMLEKKASSHRSAWLIVGLFAFVIAAITGFFVLTGSDSPCECPPEGWKIIRPPNVVTALAEGKETIWAGGPDGVFAIDRYTGEPLPVDGKPSLSYVNDLLVDRQGALWIAHRAGLTRYYAGVWKTFTETDGLLPGAVTALLEDRDGTLWVGTEKGVVRYNNESWQKFAVENGLGAVPVNVIYQDTDGVLWFGSSSINGGGVSSYNGIAWRTYTTRDGLAHNSINGIIQGQSGELWFATGFGDKGGASRLKEDQWSTLTKQDGLAGEKVRSVFEDGEGNLWFGSENNGIAVNIGTGWVILTPNDGLAGWEVMKMLQDSDGVLWLATENGISRIDSVNTALAGIKPSPSPSP